MNPRKFETVIRLSPLQRYDHFVKRAADEEQFWGLWKDEWAVLEDSCGNHLLPLWPHPDFASACATGDLATYLPKAIDLHEWLEKRATETFGKERRIAVFPSPFELATTVDPSKLKADLELELENYY